MLIHFFSEQQKQMRWVIRFATESSTVQATLDCTMVIQKQSTSWVFRTYHFFVVLARCFKLVTFLLLLFLFARCIAVVCSRIVEAYKPGILHLVRVWREKLEQSLHFHTVYPAQI